MKWHLAIVTLTFLPLISNAQTGVTEEEAIGILAQSFSEHTRRCISFVTEATTPDYFDIALHEKHNEECAGDPATSPVSVRFRINRFDKSISKYDAILGEYGTPKLKGVK